MLYRFADFELDTDRQILTKADQRVEAEPKALELLSLLIEHRDRIVEKDEILDTVWPGISIGPNSINQSVYVLRKALDDDRRSPRYIHVVRGRGVRFVGEVSRSLRPAFCGRVDELVELRGALRAAREGRGSLAVLIGAAGIGKSALLARFCSEAQETADVVWSNCQEEDGSPPLWPWIQALRTCFRSASPEAQVSLLQDCPTLARYLRPNAAEGSEGSILGSDPNAQRFLMLEAVARFFAVVSEQATTLVLALDDIHCADEWSLRLLQHLARSAESRRILIIATARPMADGVAMRAANSLEAILVQPTTRRLALRGLCANEIRGMLGDLEPALAQQSRAEALERITNGNPFLISQIREIQDLSAERLPKDVKDAVLFHFGQLPPGIRTVLQAAALMGRRCRVNDLSRMLKPENLAIQELLESAERAELGTCAGGVWSFAHILIRDVLSDQIPPHRAAELHVEAARLLRQRIGAAPEESARIAHHLLRASSVRTSLRDEAVAESTAAARECISVLAFAEARELCREAIQQLGLAGLDPAARLELLLVKGEAEVRSGQRTEGRDTILQACQLAERQGHADRLAAATLALSPGFFSLETGVVDSVTVSLLERSLELLGDSDRDLRARLLARLAIALVWSSSIERRQALVAEAANLKQPDAAGAAEIGAARIVALWSGANGRERVERSTELLGGSTSPELVLMARVFGVSSLYEVGDRERAETEAASFRSLAEHHRVKHALWYADVLRGMFALDEGALRDVEECASRITEFGAVNEDANIEHSISLFGAALSWWRDDLEPWVDTIDGIARRYPAVSAWRVARALALGDSGRIAEARSSLRPLLKPECFPENPLQLAGLTVLAHACHELGVRDQLDGAYDRLAPYRGLMAVGGYGVFSWGATDGGLGKLAAAMGRWDQAEKDLVSAIAVQERAGAVAWVAESSATLAACLVRRGRSRDAKRAHALAMKAREIGLARGLHRVVRIAEASMAPNV